ncbi:hypothetical protein [Mesorhizobium sp. 10J20-29]
MDLIQSLTVYRAAIVEAIEKLDEFPDELKEFAVEERRHLEAAITQIDERLNEAHYSGGTSDPEAPC